LPLEVFTQRNCSRLYSIELECYSQKRQIRFFEPPFGGVRVYVRTSSIDRWKVRGWLTIRYNWTFFASSYGWDIISRYWSKLAFFRRGWVTLSANFRWKGTLPTNFVWYQKTKLNTLSCGFKISTVCLFISSQNTRVTDRQNYDPQDHASIATSRGKNQPKSRLSAFLLFFLAENITHYKDWITLWRSPRKTTFLLNNCIVLKGLVCEG